MGKVSLFAFTLWGWLQSLGGIGLILLALADNSIVPLPGSMDALTIVLAASKKEWWWYYAIMATAGSLLGAYLTFRLGRKGGKEALEKKLSQQRAKKVYASFDRWGGWTLVVTCLIPPPFPLSPFLLAAGAMNYSRHKFLGAIALGRAIRYFLLAWLARSYGAAIFAFFHHYYKPIFWTAIGLALAGGIAALFFWIRYKRKKKQRAARRPKAA